MRRLIIALELHFASMRKMKKRLNASGYVIAQDDGLGQRAQTEGDLTTNLPKVTTGLCGCQEVTRPLTNVAM